MERLYAIITDLLGDLRDQLRFNASIATKSDISKFQYAILRETHIIEKALSLRDIKRGFGREKIMRLLSDISSYVDLYIDVDREFLEYPLNSIASYIRFMDSIGVEISDIRVMFQKILDRSSISIDEAHHPVEVLSGKELLSDSGGSFKSLLQSRHSIRYFESEQPDNRLIEEALDIAKYTPSACNRQGWHTHIYYGEKVEQLLKWQGGSRGFEKEPKCAIVVTSDIKAFFHYEVHQPYIDGGLYAMNLINALHSLGLGTIPLSTGFKRRKIKELHSRFDIPQNEAPILIIAVGIVPERVKVATSKRKSISQTNSIH